MNQNKDTTRQAIILGALLHDIGKFAQRAQDNPERPGQDHQRWGIDWFEKEGSLAEKLTIFKIFEENEKELVRSAINNHHHGEKYISLADGISAGMDRIELQDEEEKGDPFTDRLISIFSRVSISGIPKKDMYCKLAPLGKDNLQEAFPVEDKKCAPKEYVNLLTGFNEEIKSLKFTKLTTPQQVIGQLYFLLWKYTWCIPSAAYKHEPDVSLFDHLKTTAAITACLYDCEVKNINTVKKFMLVCGDISGIQKFIYKISSKGAAKGLKGRSLYLQLITEAVAKHLLRKNEYYLTNLLYSGGGRFYLLLDSGCENVMQREVKNINAELLRKFNGEIYLSVGTSKLAQEDFDKRKFVEKWHEAARDANNKKRQKYLGVEYRDIFEPFGEGGIEETCEICKGEPEKIEKLPQVKIGEQEIKCCQLCEMLLKLGTELSKHNSLLEVYSKKIRNGAGFHLDFIERSFYFVDEKENFREYNGKEIILYSMNSPENFLRVANKDTNIGYGFKFVGGNFAPKESGEILLFDELAESSQGIKKLGILRMDVDNLGQVFMKGLGGNTSISRVSTLSRNLDIFFNGYINIIAQKDECKDKTYIIYSEGDDLFIVGAWDVIPKLAKDIYDRFRKFTCHKLTLSGGISLIPKKYPVYKGAELTKNEEERAKEHKRKGKEKDAISFLGAVVDWNDFEIAKDMAGCLFDWIKNGKSNNEDEEKKKLNKGIIDRLRRIYLLYAGNKKFWESQKKEIAMDELRERIRYNQWLWRMVYTLDRYSRQNELFEQDVGRIKDALLKNEFNGKKSHQEIINYLGLPVRWAEFLLREEDEKNGV